MSSKRELRALTGLRAFAAFWVVLHHYYDTIATLFPFIKRLESFAQAGFIGVEVFFILSGFIISLTYSKQLQTFSARKYLGFLWKRLSRIYPAYITTLSLLVAIIISTKFMDVSLDSGVSYDTNSLVASIFMTQGWGNIRPVWNLVAWSVSVEWLAYLFFPILNLLIYRARTAAMAWTIGYGTLLICLVLVILETPITSFADDYVSILRILGCFVSGTMLYWIYDRKVGYNWNWKIITPLAAISICLGSSLFVILQISALWTTLLIPILILGLAYEGSFIVRWLSTSFMNYWGRVSYSLYLTHYVTLAILSEFIRLLDLGQSSFVVKILMFALYLGSAGIVAMGLHQFVEEPSRRVMQDLWNKNSWKVTRVLKFSSGK